MPRLVFFTIHSTTPWWKYLASQIDFADVTVLSDLRGEGDRSLVDDFYRFMKRAMWLRPQPRALARTAARTSSCAAACCEAWIAIWRSG